MPPFTAQLRMPHVAARRLAWLGRRAPMLLLALLLGCSADVQHELVGGGALTLQQALDSYMSTGLPAGQQVALIASQPWGNGQALLFRYETTNARRQVVQHLGIGFARPAGLLGWRVDRVFTSIRQPTAISRPIEHYVGFVRFAGSMRTLTRIAGRVNQADARRVRISYSDGEASVQDLVDGYFFEIYTRRVRVVGLAALDANGQPVGSLSR